MTVNYPWTAGNDASTNPPAAGNVLCEFLVTSPGNYYVQNQSADQLRLVFDNPDTGGFATITLLDPAGANSQGNDSNPPIGFFTGRIRVCGPPGSQFGARFR